MQIKDLLAVTDAKLKKINFRSSQEVKRAKGTIVGFSPEMARSRNALQTLLYEKLYRHFRIVRMTEKAKRIIGDLFKVYLDEPAQLDYTIYQRNRKYTKKEKYEMICNYIASMTDRFALAEHKKIFNPYEKV